MQEVALSNGGSILRWAGSKRQILPRLASYWCDRYERYIEPYCGSASLYAYVRPQNAILSDLNPDLIKTLKAIRDIPVDVAESLRQWNPDETTYYNVRRLEAKDLGQNDQAARFIFLNRLCFNGLYRTNLAGSFNVPWGGLKSGRLPTIDQIQGFSNLLRDADIRCCDFEDTVGNVRAGDFVYLDPPYRVTRKRVFREYMPSGFGRDDLVRLRNSLERIDKVGASFVLSYADSEEARSLAEGYRWKTVSVRRQIAGGANHRARAMELIISNEEV